MCPQVKYSCLIDSTKSASESPAGSLVEAGKGAYVFLKAVYYPVDPHQNFDTSITA